MNKEQIIETFCYHEPTSASIGMHIEVRGDMMNAVLTIASKLPDSREKTMFITAMQEAHMWAHAALAMCEPFAVKK